MIIQKGNAIYISHGGGPLPLLGDPDHLEMVDTLQVMAGRVGKPSAILVISAHWEADIPTITSGPSPSRVGRSAICEVLPPQGRASFAIARLLWFGSEGKR